MFLEEVEDEVIGSGGTTNKQVAVAWSSRSSLRGLNKFAREALVSTLDQYQSRY